jgi:hypothetical protein
MIAPLVRRGTSTHSVAQAFEKSWRMGQKKAGRVRGPGNNISLQSPSSQTTRAQQNQQARSSAFSL